MKYTMDRDSYREAYPKESADRLYPKRTTLVVTELRRRGLEASVTKLDYAIRQGQIPTPPTEGRGYVWHKENIDSAARLLEDRDALTSSAVVARHFGLDLKQLEMAELEARRKPPHYPDLCQKVISPCLPGADQPGIIRYEAPNDRN